MKPNVGRSPRRGSTLLIVMCMGAIAMFILASTMAYTHQTAALTDEAVRHSAAIVAAEAATESALSELAQDFAREGAGTVAAKISTYKARVPKGNEHGYWHKYKFKDGKGHADTVNVELLSSWTPNVPLISQYEGLKGYAATYRISSDAQDKRGGRPVTGSVGQDVQLALIPIFQFAIFYNLDLEINPGAAMTIYGRTHGNGDLFLNPAAPLVFRGDITSACEIQPSKKPGDPTIRSGGTVTFQAEHDSGVMSLNLPIGTNNSPEAVRAIVEVPPNNESVNSDLGKQRFYNNADLVITIEDSKVEVRGGGLSNGNGTNIKWSSVSNFISLDETFYDTREGKTVRADEIDIAGFIAWNALSTNALKNALHRDINSVYIADLRSANGFIRAIRLVNGATLPPLGLTVATPNPVYVKGHYNASGTSIASHNTTNTRPAAIIADAVTLLSTAWNDANSNKGLGNRTAANTTVNAALLAGIVETGNGYYSGGVENFPRFLENWSGRTMTYNGSMVVLYRSKYATGPWKGTGAPWDIYNAPGRNWAFDQNFLNPAKLPPLCPSVRAVIRGQWSSLTPGL